MNIGIIIYSRTGNTLLVGERLKNSLLKGGHLVNLERVTAINEVPNIKEPIILKTIPDLSAYDYIILGAPVQGFSLSAIFKVYLEQIPDFREKTIGCFVTEHFPKAWMGGNHSIKQMMNLIKQKGGVMKETGVVNWSSKSREEQIEDVLVRLCRI